MAPEAEMRTYYEKRKDGLETRTAGGRLWFRTVFFLYADVKEKRLNRRRRKAAAAGLAAVFWLAGLWGCQAEEEGAYRQASEIETERAEEAGAAASQKEIQAEEAERGFLFGAEIGKLTEEQKELIMAYMEAYYASLMELVPQDLSGFFAEGEEEQLLLNESALEYVTGLRKMQRSDLALADYRYELEVVSAEYLESGAVDIELTETSTQNFKEHPEIDTELYHIAHYFRLRETEDGWRISSHIQWDSIYWNLIGQYWDQDSWSLAVQDPEDFLTGRAAELLKEAERERELRGEEVPWEEKDCIRPYDREKAVAYSNRWVGRRNPVWEDFSRKGGNCQNFVSQCLFAGGIMW